MNKIIVLSDIIPDGNKFVRAKILNREDKLYLLTSSSKLKNSDLYGNVYISRDLTYQQRSELKIRRQNRQSSQASLATGANATPLTSASSAPPQPPVTPSVRPKSSVSFTPSPSSFKSTLPILHLSSPFHYLLEAILPLVTLTP